MSILAFRCSQVERVNADLLLPYAEYPSHKVSYRHVRECQPEKYANTTHEEFLSQINKKFPLDYEVEFGEYWERKWVYGHQFIISDPSRTVSVLEPLKRGGCEEQVRATAMESAGQRQCLLAVNAGFFNVTDGRCIGNVISDGYEAANSHGIQNAHFGIRKDKKLFFGYIGEDVDISADFDQLVGGVIWLVRNGENYIDVSKEAECPDAQSTGQLQGFIDVTSSRIAVGHDAEGRLIIVHVEGQTWSRGVNLNEFADYLISVGVVNAINLDGGGSVTAVVNGSLINYPGDDCVINNTTYKCERNVSTILCIHDIDCQPYDCNLHGDCFHGNCQCHDHWIGADCSQLMCGEKNCSEQGVCQPWGCECSSGWTGDDCSVPCKSGTFGKNCSLPCKCNQSASCDPVDGHCRCPAGYRGYDCQQECVYGTFGENCEAICQCVNGCGCDPQTGNCSINGKYPAFWEG
ncbi:hypothetical protein CAPTEDRAFT_91764 [Capitella teleta]|uniref:EGF-like domain-containing protein n=1 Tax=Capitella teleta TaxID=283909 RepID=R7U7D2_CAPTE|nr:hypothetical protein CAPTEDRAFT_91764 [Capitella teleta]|eukprot:ELU02036.1 hypothetical protein CAPTEDRAFT_91764 [Capitella teleta]